MSLCHHLATQVWIVLEPWEIHYRRQLYISNSLHFSDQNYKKIVYLVTDHTCLRKKVDFKESFSLNIINSLKNFNQCLEIRTQGLIIDRAVDFYFYITVLSRKYLKSEWEIQMMSSKLKFARHFRKGYDKIHSIRRLFQCVLWK